MSITLTPTVDKFEEHICNLLNQDRLSTHDIPPDGSTVHIIERKLKVMSLEV